MARWQLKSDSAGSSFMDKVHEDNIEKVMEPLFAYFKQNRKEGESFGDVCDRTPFDTLRTFSETYEPVKAVGSGRRRNRVGMSDELFAKLKAKAKANGVSMADALEAAIGDRLD